MKAHLRASLAVIEPNNLSANDSCSMRISSIVSLAASFVVLRSIRLSSSRAYLSLASRSSCSVVDITNASNFRNLSMAV